MEHLLGKSHSMFSLMACFLQVQSTFVHPFVGVRRYPDSIGWIVIMIDTC